MEYIDLVTKTLFGNKLDLYIFKNMNKDNLLILGLGSNLNDKMANLSSAILMIEQDIMAITAKSSIYQSKALLKDNAKSDWDIDFFNMAVIGYCVHSEMDILAKIKLIEKKIGRIDRGIWAPREIDIDILAYGDICFESEVLQIPHKELLNRDFAFLPLTEIAPNWAFPKKGNYYGKTAQTIAKEIKFKNLP